MRLPDYNTSLFYVQNNAEFNIFYGVNNIDKSQGSKVLIGEKIVGKCGLLKKPLYIESEKEKKMIIMTIPLLFNDLAVGVIELHNKNYNVIDDSLCNTSINSSYDDPILSALVQLNLEIHTIIDLMYIFSSLSLILHQNKLKTKTDDINEKYINLMKNLEESNKKSIHVTNKYMTLKNNLVAVKKNVVNMDNRIDYLEKINNELERSRDSYLKLSHDREVLVTNLTNELIQKEKENEQLQEKFYKSEQKIK